MTGSRFTGSGSVWSSRAVGSGQRCALCVLLRVDSAVLHTGCPSEVGSEKLGGKPILALLSPMVQKSGQSESTLPCLPPPSQI